MSASDHFPREQCAPSEGEIKICVQLLIEIAGKVRTDRTHTAGFMDIIITDGEMPI